MIEGQSFRNTGVGARVDADLLPTVQGEHFNPEINPKYKGEEINKYAKIEYLRKKVCNCPDAKQYEKIFEIEQHMTQFPNCDFNVYYGFITRQFGAKKFPDPVIMEKFTNWFNKKKKDIE